MHKVHLPNGLDSEEARIFVDVLEDGAVMVTEHHVHGATDRTGYLSDKIAPYTIVITPEHIGDRTVYLAEHPSLDGCMTHGDTVEEAITLLASARAAVLHHLERNDLEVPPPDFDACVILWNEAADDDQD